MEIFIIKETEDVTKITDAFSENYRQAFINNKLYIIGRGVMMPFDHAWQLDKCFGILTGKYTYR